MIPDEVWHEHMAADKRQDANIRDLKIAVFGCPDKPETVRHAIVPTMARLNAWLDGIATLGRILTGIIVGGAGLATMMKAIGLL